MKRVQESAPQVRTAVIEECAKIADGRANELDAGFGWGTWTPNEHGLMRGVAVRIAKDIRALVAEHGQNDDGTAQATASPSPETTLHSDMLALIKDLQARGLTTTEDHERVMSILKRAGG